jgi:ferredoxin
LEEKMIKKRMVLRFTKKTWKQPIVHHLVKDYDLAFNILIASVFPKEASLMVLEISGREENFNRGMAYLERCGVVHESLEANIRKDDDLCVHCGACTAVCPTGALFLQRPDMWVVFEPEKCSGCELCIKACPPRAITSTLSRRI